METVLGLMGLAVMIGVIVAIQKGSAAASRAVTRTVRKGAHQEGQELVSSALTFEAPVAPVELVRAVRSAVNAYPSAPTLVPGLYERVSDDTTAAFIFGSKVQEVFAGVLTSTPMGPGARGQFRVVRWTEGDGIVARRDEIGRIRERITGAVASLGGRVVDGSR